MSSSRVCFLGPWSLRAGVTQQFSTALIQNRSNIFGILAFYKFLFGQTLFVPGQGGTTITNIKQSAEKNKSSSGQIKLCYSQPQTIQSKVQSINVYLEPTFCRQSTERPVWRPGTDLRSRTLLIFSIKRRSILIESFKIFLHLEVM